MSVGRIAGPFGVRGELKVELLTDFPNRFRGLETLHVGENRVSYHVVRVRRHQQRLLVTLDGIENPEDAAALRGQEIFVPREEAVRLSEGHYYLDDLLGASVFTVAGQPVGRVSEVLRTGSNDVFVVGQGRDAVLVPSIRDAVASIDVAAGRIVIESWVLEHDE